MASFEELVKLGNSLGKNSDEEKKKKEETYEGTSFDDLVKMGSQMRKQEEMSKVDDDYINGFIDSSNRFFDTVAKDYESVGWDNANQIYQKHQDTIDYLNSWRDVIKDWAVASKDTLDGETYKYLSDILSNYYLGSSSAMKTLSEAKDYYDPEKNQDAYHEYVRYQNGINYDLTAGQKKIDDLSRAMDLEKELEDDQYLLDNWPGHHDWLEPSKEMLDAQGVVTRRIERNKLELSRLKESYGIGDDDLGLLLGNEKNDYANAEKIQDAESLAQYIQDVKNRPDFAENSKYKSTANGKERSYALTGHLKESGFDDLEYDYINKNPDAVAARVNNDVANNAAVYGLDSGEQQEMNEDEIAVYNYLYATEGRDAAKKFVTTITSDLNYRERKRREEEARARAQEHPFKESVGTVLTSPMKTISYIGQLADYLADGEINQNAGYNKYSYESTAVRSAVSETIEASGKWGKAGSFLYNTGMSMGDFLMTTAISGGNGTIAMAIMGTGAAADMVISAKDRGLNDNQAFALGTVAGLAEALTERVSLEALLNPDALADGAWKYILKNMLAEGSEEAASGIINLFSDILISKDQSEWNQNILKLMNEGKTREEAFGIVFAEQAKSVGLDALGGMLSGGVMGGGGVVVNSAMNIGTKSKLGSQQDALVKSSLELDPNNQFAIKMQSRLNAGKNLSGTQLNGLEQVTKSLRYAQYMDDITNSAKSALTKYGETNNIQVVSKAIAKQILGEELTWAEQRSLSKSQYGQKVASELNTDMIKAQEYISLIQKALSESDEDIDITKEHSDVEVQVSDPEKTAKVAELKGEIASLQETVQNPDISAEEKAVATEQLEAAEQELKALESGTSGTEEQAQTPGKKVKVTAKVASEPVSLEEASKKYGAQAKAMVATYNKDQNVRMFDSAYSVAYEMGKVGPEMMEYALKSEATQYLTPEQREHAFNAGLATRQARTDSLDRNAKASGKNVRIEGTVKVEGNPSEFREALKNPDDPRRDAIKTLMTIAKVTGINIVLTKSKVDAQGRLVGDQGAFKWSNDTIYIDINAGVDYARDTGELTKYTMLRTFSHEFTHFLEKYAPKEYSALQDLVFAEMKAKLEGTKQTIDDLIVDKQKEYKDISYEEASREVVAESMTDMLRDASFIEKLTQKHQTLAQKLITKLKEFLANIKSYFAQVADNPSTEAKLIQQEVDGTVKYLESIIEAFDTAAVAAVENYQGMTEDVVSELTPGEEGVVVAEDGEPVAYSTEDGTVMLSIRTYEEEGRTEFKKYLDKCVKNKSLTKAEMQEMLDGIEEIYTVCKEFKDKYAPFSAWSDAEVIRDTHGKPVFSVVTPNGEYKMNLDFSLVCKKRRTLDAVFNEMSKRGIIDDFELGKKTVVKINELIRKYGFETACSLCFVDAKRFRQADVADSVVRLYNELVQSLVPEEHSRSIGYFNFAGYDTITSEENSIHTWPNSKLDFSHINEVLKQYGKGTVEAKAARYIKNNPEARRLLLRGDFMSSGGFDAVKSQNENIMKIYNSKKGTGGPKAAFGDVQYMNEIISKAKSWTPAKAYDVGGVRIQSFSDYVPRMVFDYVQMMYDLAVTKLPAHAYTKEALFVKQFGLTGVKINMSLIPAVVKGGIAPGLDANGNYAWAGESFDFETAKAIQKAPGYSENCGTICVGVSYEHILKLLRDPDIRMVIPYHKSGLNPIVAHMNNIAEFTDYTSLKTNPGGCQSTMDKNGSKVKKEFDFSKNLHDMADADPRALADQYLAWCDEHGYTPKFAEFRGEENYYKLLTDFTVYDESGTYVPQREVRAVFPKEGDTFGSMRDLIQEGLEEDAIIQGKRDSKMSEMVDEIERTIPRTEAEISDDEQVEQADHDLEADFVEEDIDSEDENRVQYQARNYSKPSYKKISAQEYRQIQEDRMTKYGDKFGSMPNVDCTFAHDQFYIFENFDESQFGVLKVLNPEVNQKEIAAAMEVFDSGNVQSLQDYRRRVKNLRTLAKRHKSDSSVHRDRRSGVGNVGLDDRHDRSGNNSERIGLPEADSDDYEQHQVRTYSQTDSDDYAPTFYSQMARVVSGMKQEKFGASSVVDMLRGRGVKAEEIKWSGIEAWLEGKKSVTKAELQEFIAGSMLQIEEDVLTDKEIPYSQEHLDQIAKYESERDIIAEHLKSEWKRIVGTDIPIAYFGAGLESAVVNNLMLANNEKKGNTEIGYQHKAKRAALQRIIEDSDDYFGFDTARQAFREAVIDPKGFMKAYDLSSFEESVFKDFIKAKEAYAKVEGISIEDQKALKAIAESADRFSNRIVDVKNKHRSEAAKHLSKYRAYTIKGGTNYRELLFRIPESNYSNGAMYAHWERSGVLAHARIQDINTFLGKMLFIEELQSDWHNEGRKTGYEGVPDAPFRDNYHEFVLKKLIRMAAEQGYDSIGWTPAEIQSERWSDEFAEGYRIEYDQDIPKFLNKYGKKWDTKVGKTVLDSGTEVWSMAITDAMKDSVLYEGQAQYQKRTNTLTDHEILDMAAKELDTAKLTDGERAALEIFRKKNDALKALKDERQKQGSLYYQYQFGDQKDTAKATAARNRMTVLDSQITKASAEVLGIEDKKVLKDVLQKSRKVIEQHERKASVERVRAAREEARVKERKIANEKLEALREKKNERIAEVRAEERKKAQDKTDNRKKTELRAKIQKQLGELNSLLTNGNKKKNVKNGMKDTASALLAYGELLFSDDANLTPEAMVRNGIETDLTEVESKLLNEYNDLLEKRDLYLGQINEAASGTDANKDARIEGLQKMVDIINQKKLPSLIKKLDGVFERERARLNKVTFSAVLKDLTDSYKALEKSKDPYVSGAYNQYVYDRLVAMNNPDAGVATTIKDMSLTQLAELNDAIKMVVTSIKNANTLFRDGQREVLAERAEQVFMEIRKLYRKGGDPTAFKHAVTDRIKSFAWNELKPIYAFERIGSDKFTELFWDVINGESEYGLECDKAADFVRELRESSGYKKWDFDKVKVFKTVDGQDFKLTLGDMMSIYAYSRRDQAHKHMFEGGFTFHTGKTETYKDTDGKKRVRLVAEDTYRMTPELLDKILSSLSKEQKAYAEAMQDYLTKLGEMGNKVSRVLYGIDLFKETHYFPLKSDRDYRSTVETQLNKTQTAASLVNIGMAKETVPEASNPIVLQRFDDVAVQHIDQMLKYSSMVLPIENLRKVMDFAPGEYGTWNAPVKKLITTVHGAAASQYVNQWLTDLNGSSGLDGAKNPLSSMFARSKKVAVAGNLSVVVQQYFAVARAMSEIDGKYFIDSNGKADGSQWEELKKWAGVAVIKDIGGFDMGSARSATDYIGKAGTKAGVMDTIDKVASYGSAKMDELGWGTIWRAAKAEIADTTNLKVGSEEFFKAAAKRFTEVVVKTQVYDSVTARSGYMRSKSEAVKYLVSFMGEPTTTINMMLNAQMKLFRAQKYGTKADVKKAGAYMARTSGAVILSTVLGIIAKSAVYAMRDDDDETESFLERYVKQIGSSFHQELNPLNLLPVARDIMSMIKGRDIERPDMALINSTIKAFRKALKADENQLEAWVDVVLSVGNLWGLPLKNVLRDGAGVVRLIGDITDDIGPKDLGKTFFKEGFLGEESTKNETLYAAIVTEDAGRLEVLRKGYKSDTDYTNAIRKALRECDDRIYAAAKARYEGDTMTYSELAKEIIAEGHFIQDDVVAAIMAEVTAMENEAAGEKASYPKVYSMYTAADYLSVVDQPKASKEIKDYLINQYLDKGKTNAEAEAEFKSDLKDQIKTWYTDEESKVRITKQEATEMLRKYVGMDSDELTATINQWSSKVVTGIAYEDIKDEFFAGNLTASRAIDMRVRYGGESREDAQKVVEGWNFEKKYSFSYSDRKNAYINGEVSASELRNAMITYGGMTAEEADENIRAYDWLKRNPKYDLSVSDVIAYTKPIADIGKSIEQTGINPDVYMQYKDLRSKCKGVDANGDGKTDSGSVKTEVLKAIDSLPISASQKDALYYLNGWAKSKLWEAPWH